MRAADDVSGMSQLSNECNGRQNQTDGLGLSSLSSHRPHPVARRWIGNTTPKDTDSLVPSNALHNSDSFQCLRPSKIL